MEQYSAEVKAFLRELNHFKQLLTRKEMLTIRGQAIHGDVAGARRGLDGILKGSHGIRKM